MGMISGDKSRYQRQRRKKLAKRVEMRALRSEAAASTQSKGTDSNQR